MYAATITCSDIPMLYDALKPEEVKMQRFSISVRRGRGSVTVSINSADSTALKAAATSVLRLIEAAERIHNGRAKGTQS